MINSIVKVVRGIVKLRGGTDNTIIGNTGNAVHTHLKDASGTAFGTSNNPLYVTQSLAIIPIFELKISRVIAAQKTYYQTQTVSNNTAIKEFHFSGSSTSSASASGVCVLSKYVDATLTTIFGFNSVSEVNQWSNTGPDPADQTYSYSTTQAYAGTGSAQCIFTQSDANNYAEFTHTYSSPTDYSDWRYITAGFYQQPSTGASVARTISIRLQDINGNIRVYQTAITTATTAGWVDIKGELTNPASQTGTTFDLTQISKISLRMVDASNRTGTVYWDRIRLEGQITTVDKICTSQGNTIQLKFDPIKSFSAGDVMLIAITNTSSNSFEYFTNISGVI